MTWRSSFCANGRAKRGYVYDIRTRTFTRVLVPGAPAGPARPDRRGHQQPRRRGRYARTSAQTDAFLRLE